MTNNRNTAFGLGAPSWAEGGYVPLPVRHILNTYDLTVSPVAPASVVVVGTATGNNWFHSNAHVLYVDVDVPDERGDVARHIAERIDNFDWWVTEQHINLLEGSPLLYCPDHFAPVRCKFLVADGDQWCALSDASGAALWGYPDDFAFPVQV